MTEIEEAVKAMLVDDPNWICAGIPDHVIEAGIEALDKVQHDLANYVSGETADWDEGMIVAAIFKAMLRDANGEVLTFKSILDAEAAARQIEIDTAVKAEVEKIVAWLWLHGMCQIANSVEKGHYK